MTMGYPGSTSRYLSSFGIDERINTDNAAMINVRTIKQAIWKNAMEKVMISALNMLPSMHKALTIGRIV